MDFSNLLKQIFKYNKIHTMQLNNSGRFLKMSEFQEDMIFKNVNEEDTKLFLEILGIKSQKAKIMTQELRQMDPSAFLPDIILELDDEIRLIELQSTKVRRLHNKRFYVYMALSTYRFDKIGKKINLSVFSTAEKSKKSFSKSMTKMILSTT